MEVGDDLFSFGLGAKRPLSGADRAANADRMERHVPEGRGRIPFQQIASRGERLFGKKAPGRGLRNRMNAEDAFCAVNQSPAPASGIRIELFAVDQPRDFHFGRGEILGG